ncbi:uncharacterized protein TNCV_4508071 [Trichonephila clavipes]|nr:uncharacterized protein TNCV_4508071 [Trichonephila clavipes]
MFDGLVAFAMDRWRHDCGARRVRIISRPGSPMSEGRFDLSTFRSERTNEASTLTITPKRSSSRDVVPLRHGGTLNSRRAASPLVRLEDGEERWEAPDPPEGVLPQNWGGTELNRTVTCMVLKDRRTSSPLP